MPAIARLGLERRIEALLARQAGAGGPGLAVGVMLGGGLAIEMQAGLASLELGVPIGPETCFRIASVSKQFTCAAILQLAAQGRLAIDAPARTLIPELPEAAASVTVAQLMANTSGLRDMLEIMRFGGADLGTPVAMQDLLDGIVRQRGLNFAPGSRYLYSNTNFLLLGLIVERLTEQPLAEVLRERIFAPLGMTRTRHTPSVQVAEPGLATGYLKADGGIIRAPHAFPLGGEGGLVSCVRDLLIWAANCATGRIPAPGVARGLAQLTPFTNGTASLYARGLVVRRHRGVVTLGHGGLWPGFRTDYLRIPELDAAVIVIANSGAIDPGAVSHGILDCLLDDAGRAPAPKLPPRADLLPLAGRYADSDSDATLDIAVGEDGVPVLSLFGLPAALAATDDGWLAIDRGSSVFALRPAGADAIEVLQDAGTRSTWHRLPDTAELPADLAGTWHSAEMAADWSFAEGAAGLCVRARGPVVRGPEWPVEAVAPGRMRVHIPGSLAKFWLDVRLDPGGGRLIAHGGRARHVGFARA